MNKNRMEAFSDGVLAIIITIMVLEIKVPHGSDWLSVKPLMSVLMSYVLSFVYVAIYWNNHHHLMQAVHKINGSVLWANTFLLFWLSLLPVSAGWMGENHFDRLPVVIYGADLIMAAISFTILLYVLKGLHGQNTILIQAIGNDKKGPSSIILYAVGIALSFIVPWAGAVIYLIVAGIWFIPDKRIENLIMDSNHLS